MKQLLKVMGWGLTIWALSLAWPAGATLTPRVADAFAVGMVVALSAYFLGHHFTKLQTERPEGKTANQFVEARRPTRPSNRVRRASRATRPIPELARSRFFWRANRPVWMTPERIQHPRITRPIPETR